MTMASVGSLERILEDMPERSFQELVDDLLTRRKETSDPPPILLLGAGASVDAGVGAMPELYKQFRVRNFEEFERKIADFNERERYRQLHEFLQTSEPSDVTPGYHALAQLCANYYFDVIFTTNLDPLLDDALASARMRRRDYLLLVNGIIRADRLRTLLFSAQPRVKVLKLHGDLFHRFMAWTGSEMQQFLQDVEAPLVEFVRNRDVLVVGHSLRDDRIRQLALASDGAVWLVALGEVHEEVAKSAKVRVVRDAELTFENLFVHIAHRLGLETTPASRVRGEPRVERTGADSGEVGRGQVCTMDDFVASVVGIAERPDAQPLLTGFVLQSPRVIVTDGWVARAKALSTATIVAKNGARFVVSQIGTVPGHAFGPALFEVPPALTAAGLSLAPGAESGSAVHVAVAAGNGIGISSGLVGDATALDVTIDVDEVGAAQHLSRLVIAVTAGSAGAPAVNAAFELEGFVVARAESAEEAYMFPAARWLDAARAVVASTVEARAGSELGAVHQHMLDGLYDTMNDGFEAALRAADAYLAHDPDPQDEVFWLRYAAAQGQRAKRALARGQADRYFEARARALTAAQKASALSPSAKQWLSSLWDPNDPLRVEGEDDLYVFKDDLDFRRLLGSSA
jgi:hypothetical protein